MTRTLARDFGVSSDRLQQPPALGGCVSCITEESEDQNPGLQLLLRSTSSTADLSGRKLVRAVEAEQGVQ